MSVHELLGKAKQLLGNKKVVAITAGLAIALLASGVAYTFSISSTTPNTVTKTRPPLDKKIIKDFDIHAAGDIGELKIIAPAHLALIDKAGDSVGSVCVELGESVTFKSEGLQAGKYAAYLTENPVLSDGSVLILPKSVECELEALPESSNIATMTVEVRLVRVGTDDMTQQQLFNSAEKLRAVGDTELADRLVERIISAPMGESDDGSAKPEGWEDSALNPHKNMEWRATVTKEVKVVTKQAWTETVVVGGTLTTTIRCACGAGPFSSQSEWVEHSNKLQHPEMRYYDYIDGPVLTFVGHPYRMIISKEVVGGTPEQIHHPEQFKMETHIVSPAGWYESKD